MLFGCVETNQGSNEINSLRRRANTSTLFVNSVDHIWWEITRGVKLPEYSSRTDTNLCKYANRYYNYSKHKLYMDPTRISNSPSWPKSTFCIEIIVRFWILSDLPERNYSGTHRQHVMLRVQEGSWEDEDLLSHHHHTCVERVIQYTHRSST